MQPTDRPAPAAPERDAAPVPDRITFGSVTLQRVAYAPAGLHTYEARLTTDEARALATPPSAGAAAVEPEALHSLDASPYGETCPVEDFAFTPEALLAALRRAVAAGRGFAMVSPRQGAADMLAWAERASAPPARAVNGGAPTFGPELEAAITAHADTNGDLGEGPRDDAGAPNGIALTVNAHQAELALRHAIAAEIARAPSVPSGGAAPSASGTDVSEAAAGHSVSSCRECGAYGPRPQCSVRGCPNGGRRAAE